VLRDSGAETLVVLAPLLRTYDAVGGDTPVRRVVVASIEDAMPAPVAAGYVAKARAEGTYAEVPARDGLHAFARLAAEAPERAEPVALDVGRAVAVLQYTGGTTGTSKGAMLTHRNLVANCLQTRAWSPQLRDGEEVTVAVLPFFHIYGLTVVLNMSVVAGGATLVVLPRFEPAEVLAAVERARATVLPLVPSMFVGLNAAMGAAEARGERPDLSSLRLANAGGAAMPPEVAREFTRRVGLPVHEGYGLSEASPVTHFNPGWMPPREGSIGLPVPDVDSKIVDAEGRSLPPGEVGEVCVRGPNVMLGYWNRPDETARALRDDAAGGDDPVGGRGPWLHTGDLGRMEPDGYVTIVDRAKDMVLVGGYNVYPREIEEVLYEHPAVQEAAAYGVPDAYLGRGGARRRGAPPRRRGVARGAGGALPRAARPVQGAARGRGARRAAEVHRGQAAPPRAARRGGGPRDHRSGRLSRAPDARALAVPNTSPPRDPPPAPHPAPVTASAPVPAARLRRRPPPPRRPRRRRHRRQQGDRRGRRAGARRLRRAGGGEQPPAGGGGRGGRVDPPGGGRRARGGGARRATPCSSAASSTRRWRATEAWTWW
jgi:long-chain acyl-CoA synthetase